MLIVVGFFEEMAFELGEGVGKLDLCQSGALVCSGR